MLSSTYLYALGGFITAARLSHALQLMFPDVLPIQFRMFGFLATALFFVVAGALAFLVGLQVMGGSPAPLWVPNSWVGTLFLHAHHWSTSHNCQDTVRGCGTTKLEHTSWDGVAQETPYISSNLLGNHRSWLGYAQEKAGQASDAAQSGYQAAKDKAAEF